MTGYTIGASFLGTGVKLTEAMTFIMAVGAIRGWKNTLLDASAALTGLSVLAGLMSVCLGRIHHVWWIHAVVGLLMLLIGVRWLRKSILHYSGLKKQPAEARHCQLVVVEQQKTPEKTVQEQGMNKLAFSTVFCGAFFTGFEAAFIIAATGFTGQSMTLSINGALSATIAVITVGLLFRKIFVKISIIMMKFLAGLLLASLGAFSAGEGIRVAWPQENLSLLYLTASLFIFSLLVIQRSRILLDRSSSHNESEWEG